MLAPQKSLFSDVLAVSGFCHGGAPVFLLVLALCCRSTCQFRRNSEKSNHMLSATSHIELEFLTKFLNMSKLQNRLILLYQSLPLQCFNFFICSQNIETSVALMTKCPNSSRNSGSNVCNHIKLFPPFEIVFIFRPHMMGEENHNLCCVFSKFCQTSLDYFSYLTISVTTENTLVNKEVTAENIPVLSGRLVHFQMQIVVFTFRNGNENLTL